MIVLGKGKCMEVKIGDFDVAEFILRQSEQPYLFSGILIDNNLFLEKPVIVLFHRSFSPAFPSTQAWLSENSNTCRLFSA